MSRKNDPTKPTKNAEGKDVHVVKTMHDLVRLHQSLPPDGRALLEKDLVLGLQKGSAHIDKANPLLRKLMLMVIGVSGIRWINDDKGKVTASFSFGDVNKPFHTEEL